jgi:1-acyl-sn-glycerol-3-phosphate acyltransferase
VTVVTYAVVVRLGQALFRLLGLRISVEHGDRVPASGPVVLAANHVSFLDFLLLGLVGRLRGRRVRFLARHELWQPWPVGAAMQRMGHIPVDRAAPAHAYLLAREALRRGEVVGVFPEAGVSRSFTIRGMMPGAVALAAETGATLVPVGLWGGQRLLTAGVRPRLCRGVPVGVAVGRPRHIDVGADVRRETRRLGVELQLLLDRLQHSPEHQPEPGTRPPWHPRHLGGGAPSVAEATLAEQLPRGAVRPPLRTPA